MAADGPLRLARRSSFTFFSLLHGHFILFSFVATCWVLGYCTISANIVGREREREERRERERGQFSIVKVVVVRRAVRSFHILLLCTRARDSCPLLLLLLQDLPSRASIYSLCAWEVSLPLTLVRDAMRRGATRRACYFLLSSWP